MTRIGYNSSGNEVSRSTGKESRTTVTIDPEYEYVTYTNWEDLSEKEITYEPTPDKKKFKIYKLKLKNTGIVTAELRA